MVVGYSGAFKRLMQSIPHSTIMAMLAGVLLVFGTRIFTSTRLNPLLGLLMLVVFFLGRTLKWRAPLLASFAVGLLTVIFQSKINIPEFQIEAVTPLWYSPTFSLGSFFTLTIPIFLMVMTTQNAPGLALLKAVNYQAPVNQIVHFGGTLSLLGAGFGGAGVNISAMTATIAISPEADPNPRTRYFSGVVSGVAYCVAAIFAGVFSSLYGAFPIELTAILAGLALLPVITSSLADALSDRSFRDSSVVTFLVTISGVSGWGIGAPFWGLIAGVLVHRLTERGLAARSA
jgi:benzoate membrane transport protein